MANLLTHGLARDVDDVLAALSLWIIDQLEAKGISPQKADEVFTLLDVFLTDERADVELSKEAEELLAQAQLLHHFGGDYGPDPTYLRKLARAILARTA